MKIVPTIVALGVISIFALFSADSAAAKSADTKQTKEKKPAKVVVTVKAGDTLESIARAHKTTYVRLYNANKGVMNPDVIDIGDKIRIPAKKEKLKNRFANYQAQAVAPAATSYGYTAAPTTYYNTYSGTATPVAYQAGSSAGNTYYDGYCTWYAKDRRPDLPNRLGNGGEWAASAAAQGYKTGSAPKTGAVAEQAGHVAYVEKVHKNGTVTVSEMNYTGHGQVSKRTVPASTFRSYIY